MRQKCWFFFFIFLTKRFSFTTDDLNMPQKETYGAQPAVELLRQLIDHKHLYDMTTVTRVDLVDIVYITAMIPAMNTITGL